jgi:hypothetical protein
VPLPPLTARGRPPRHAARALGLITRGAAAARAGRAPAIKEGDAAAEAARAAAAAAAAERAARDAAAKAAAEAAAAAQAVPPGGEGRPTRISADAVGRAGLPPPGAAVKHSHLERRRRRGRALLGAAQLGGDWWSSLLNWDWDGWRRDWEAQRQQRYAEQQRAWAEEQAAREAGARRQAEAEADARRRAEAEAAAAAEQARAAAAARAAEEARERAAQAERERAAAAQWAAEAAARDAARHGAQQERGSGSGSGAGEEERQREREAAAAAARQADVEARVREGVRAQLAKRAARRAEAASAPRVGGGPPPGPPGSPGLAVSFTARPQSRHTVLLPSRAVGAPLERGGALPHLEFDGRPWQLQQALLGGGAGGAQEAFGSAQGWLDPAALLGKVADSGGGGGGGGPRRGVQFQLACERCWLLLDGAVAAGTRDGAATSPCVALPGAGDSRGDGDANADASRLVHLELQFAAKSLPVAALLVRYRTCDPGAVGGSNSGGGDFAALGAALAPGWVLAPEALAAGGYAEGLLCEVAPAGDPGAPRAAGGGGDGSSPPPGAVTVFVPRRPGAPGAGGVMPASARRFAGARGRVSAGASVGQAALNASAAVAAARPPDAPASGQEEEEEARERADRAREAAAAAAAPPAAPQQPLPALPGPGGDALTALLNNLLGTWWGGGGGGSGGGDAGYGGFGGGGFGGMRRRLLAGDNDSGGGRGLRQAGAAAAQPQKQQQKQPQQPQPPRRDSRVLSLTPAGLAPGLAAAHPPGALFDVSCWAFWNGTLGANASIGADPSGSLVSAAMYAGGARLDAAPAAPSYVAAVGIDSVLADWEAQRDRLRDAGFSAPGGGLDGAPGGGLGAGGGDLGVGGPAGGDGGSEGPPGFEVAPGAYSGGPSGLLRLLVLEWRGALGDAALWVGDARGPWELEPGALWVPGPAPGDAAHRNKA